MVLRRGRPTVFDLHPWVQHPLTTVQQHRVDFMAGRLRLMADQFDAEMHANLNLNAAAPMEGAFLGVQLRNGALLGAFAALPIPDWARVRTGYGTCCAGMWCCVN